MLTSVDDILEELCDIRPTQAEAKLPLELVTPRQDLSELERELMDCFTGGELCLSD
jgi:hypothetical protein